MSGVYSEYLSPQIVELLEKHFGGSEVTFPCERKGKTWERLKEAIGEDGAGACIRWFQGETQYIHNPTVKTARQAIIELGKQGKKAGEICKLNFLTKYSRKQIDRILKEST